MEHENNRIESEIDDLRLELEHFQQEKERVRAIIGRVGGCLSFIRNSLTQRLLF